MKPTFLLGWLCTIAMATLLVSGCKNADSKENANDFKSYWYSGQAEITRYALEQARYGEIHKGDAVLIFVTEDFLSDKQVKYEFGDNKTAISILKLNFTRKFNTGIYPYSIMSSIFTPVDTRKYPTLKVTSSSQEWCGHTFMQLNNKSGKINVQLRSYFQAEGDQDFQLDSQLLEDEIWTKIRLAPASLPTGEIKIIPGAQFARLRHIVLKVEDALASLHTTSAPQLSEKKIQVYMLQYKNLERSLTIKFEKNFPYQILAWEESYPGGFGPDTRILTTRAVKTHSIKTDYWTKNKVSDSHLREELGLIY